MSPLPQRCTLPGRHMKRQPSLCHCCPRHGRRHCNCRCHLHCRCQLCCCCRLNCPSLLPLLLAIAIAAAINHCMVDGDSVASPSAIAVAVALAVGHCSLHHHRLSQLPSPSTITFAIAVGHLRELLPWRGKNCI